MAIRTFKEIIDNKGYRVNSKDRKIFEEGNLQSFFGFSENDMIEFIVYDNADNELPQINGQLARYIPLTTDNIRDYLMIPEGTLFQQKNFPKEYFVDAERLLREAGYNNGTFKTQITLLNARAGKPNDTDRLWIQEISPSRLEVRLLPLRKNGAVNNELENRYNIFVNGGQFREDTIPQISSFIETIDPQFISQKIISNFGEQYFQAFLDEYKIANFDTFVEQVYTKFKEVAKNEFNNKYSDFTSENYGREKESAPKLELSVEEIKRTSLTILIKVIDSFLHKPQVRQTAEMDVVTDESIDINKILKERDTDIKPTANDRVPKDKNKVYSDKMDVVEAVIEKTPTGEKGLYTKNTKTLRNEVLETEELFTPTLPPGGVISSDDVVPSVPSPPVNTNQQQIGTSVSQQTQRVINKAQNTIAKADEAIKAANNKAANNKTNPSSDI
jgi:hypothetical protein